MRPERLALRPQSSSLASLRCVRNSCTCSPETVIVSWISGFRYLARLLQTPQVRGRLRFPEFQLTGLLAGVDGNGVTSAEMLKRNVLRSDSDLI